MTKSPWQTISSKIVYKSKWLQVNEDQIIQPDGQPGIYAYAEKSPGCFVVARTAEDEIILVKEFRYVLDQEILNLPAGSMTPGKTPEESAKAELQEETGFLANKWQYLGRIFVAPGHDKTYEEVFLAEDLTMTEIDRGGDESIIGIVKIPLSELKKDIAEGKILCGPSLAALNLFFCKENL